MNFSIFSGWLKRLAEYVAQTKGRKISLLIDNASSHGCIQNLPVLSNVEVIYLPKNTTSCLQPLDAGIIASLKKRYRRMQYEHASCLLQEESTQDLYNVNILVACKTITLISNAIEGIIIFNCWEKTRLINSASANDSEPSEEEMYVPDMEEEDGCVGSILELQLVQIGFDDY